MCEVHAHNVAGIDLNLNKSLFDRFENSVEGCDSAHDLAAECSNKSERKQGGSEKTHS
jgi:hypothetical protein